jgi:hypothetical protein
VSCRIHTSTVDINVLKVIHDHNHGSEAARVEADKIKNVIKRNAIQTSEIQSVILNNAIRHTSAAFLGKMPKKYAIRKMIQDERNERRAAPPMSIDRTSIVVSESYGLYEYSAGMLERFLFYDSSVGDVNRILIFGRKSHSNWSDRMMRLYADGLLFFRHRCSRRFT